MNYLTKVHSSVTFPHLSTIPTALHSKSSHDTQPSLRCGLSITIRAVNLICQFDNLVI